MMKRTIVTAATAATLMLAGTGTANADNFRLTIGAGHPADASVWITMMRDFLAPEIAKRADITEIGLATGRAQGS